MAWERVLKGNRPQDELLKIIRSKRRPNSVRLQINKLVLADNEFYDGDQVLVELDKDLHQLRISQIKEHTKHNLPLKGICIRSDPLRSKSCLILSIDVPIEDWGLDEFNKCIENDIFYLTFTSSN